MGEANEDSKKEMEEEGKEGKEGKEACSSLSYKHRTATGTHVPYGITQCYLPPGRGDISAFTTAN